MKKILTLVALVCAMPFYGQQKVARKLETLVSQKSSIKQVSPLKVNPDATAGRSAAVVKNATYATIDFSIIDNIVKTRPDVIEVEIPYNGNSVTLQMYKANIFADGFHVDTDAAKNVDYEEGAYYRGIIKGDRASLASFSFFKDEMNGIVSSVDFNNLVVAKLRREKNISDYIIYSDKDLNILNKFSCGESELGRFEPKNNEHTSTTFGTEAEPVVTVYFELDHELFQQNGSLGAAGNWITSVFNNIQTLYANDGINVALDSYFVWSSPDPYFGTTSNQYLNQFFGSTGFTANVGQLIGIDEGGLGGLAALSGLCNANNRSYVDVDLEFEDVPVFSWTVEAMTHELGHQFGSPHTHSCAWNGNNTPIDSCGDMAGFPEGNCGDAGLPAEQGTIMSYCHLVWEVGINLANGFGEQPRNLIQDYINSRSCLALGTNDNVIVDFSYYPNPSNGILNIVAGEEIEEVTAYTIAGQVLFTKKINATEAIIDLSSFANGVYFFKAVSGAKEMNFKVVKQD